MHPILYLILVLTIYSPLLTRFFWSDDWYLLDLAQILSRNGIGVLQAFSFFPSDFTTPVYRPLSSEGFFWIMKSLFGLNPVPYHMVSFAVWSIGMMILYKLLRSLLKSHVSWIAWLLCLFSASHFTRLTYLSAFQEILMFTAVVSAIYVMHVWQGQVAVLSGLGLFIVGLLSKESSIAAPFLMVLVHWYSSNAKLKIQSYVKYVPFFIVLGIYLYFRFVVRGLSGVGEAYSWDFSPLRAVHTAFWYGLWSVGVPEFIIDYMGSGFRLIPRFWDDFREFGLIFASMVSLLGGYVGITSLGLLIMKKKPIKEVVFGILWFSIGLGPILFLPTHKYALGQSVGLVGCSIALAVVIGSLQRRWQNIFLVLYIAFNIFGVGMYYRYHVSMQRSDISKKVYDHVTTTYPIAPAGFYFRNDEPVTHAGWGQSLQIEQAIGTHFTRVVYSDNGQNPYVAFEDAGTAGLFQEDWVLLESSQFLR